MTARRWQPPKRLSFSSDPPIQSTSILCHKATDPAWVTPSSARRHQYATDGSVNAGPGEVSKCKLTVNATSACRRTFTFAPSKAHPVGGTPWPFPLAQGPPGNERRRHSGSPPRSRHVPSGCLQNMLSSRDGTTRHSKLGCRSLRPLGTSFAGREGRRYGESDAGGGQGRRRNTAPGSTSCLGAVTGSDG